MNPLRGIASRRLRQWICAALLSAVPIHAAGQGVVPAQAPQGEGPYAWHTTRLPGGLAGLERVTGPGAVTSPAMALLKTIRQVSQRLGPSGPTPNVVAYFHAVDRLEQALAALPNPGHLSLADAGRVQTRQRIAEAAESLGYVVEQRPSAFRLALDDRAAAVSQKRYIELAGVDVASVVTAVNRGETVAVVVPADEVPLPLAPAVWTSRLLDGMAPGRSIVAAILTDERARWLYHGLAALDADTLSFVAATPGLLEHVRRDRARTFGLFAGAVRVRNGSVITPGGDLGRALWERLIDCPAGRPEQFIRNLFSADEGRLAWFYSTTDQLSEGQRRHVLGFPEGNPERAFSRLRALSWIFRDIMPGWKIEERPLWRPPEDPALFVAAQATDAQGRLKGPVSRRLWEAAFSGGAETVALPRKPRDPEDAEAVDVAWLAERVFAPPPNSRRRRFELVLFAQREFATASGEDGPDLLVALRGFWRFPTLALTLERMGVTDPGVHAALVRHAQRITHDGNTSTVARRLAVFQGALALVERARFAGTIDTETSTRLAASLARVETNERGDYEGRLTVWLRREFVVATQVAAARDDTLEGAVVGALAGVSAARSGEAGPPVEWEGGVYRVDHAAAERERLTRIRATQAGCTLDLVDELTGMATSLMADAQTVDDVRARATALESIDRQLAACGSDEESPDTISASDIAATLRRAKEELGAMRHARDLVRMPEIARSLVRLGDTLLGDVLTAIVYASVLTDCDDELMRDGAIPRRHRFSAEMDTGDERLGRPWTRATINSGQGRAWRVVGSLLGLDLALANFAVRPISTDPPTRAPTIDAGTRDVLNQHVVVMSRSQPTDVARDRVAACLAAGRAEVTRLLAEPAALDAPLARAGVSAWRREELRWVSRQASQNAADVLSLAELVRLGCDGDDTEGLMAAWGISGLPLGGAFTRHYPDGMPWELFALRTGLAAMGTHFVDLNLRVAEALAELRMPAVLARPVLSLATYDFAMEVPLGSPDDWTALTTQARRLTTERIADYIAALTANGPLWPVAQANGERR